MKHPVIESTLNTLQKTYAILKLLSDEQLKDTSIAPYYSSIGSHIRHILDFYDCALSSESIIDLTKRKRNLEVENYCSSAEKYLLEIEKKIFEFNKEFDSQILVLDDLGIGKIEILYTYSALFSQANSHTIHHYAIINYIFEGLNIKIQDEAFGFNPTTPK